MLSYWFRPETTICGCHIDERHVVEKAKEKLTGGEMEMAQKSMRLKRLVEAVREKKITLNEYHKERARLGEIRAFNTSIMVNYFCEEHRVTTLVEVCFKPVNVEEPVFADLAKLDVDDGVNKTFKAKHGFDFYEARRMYEEWISLPLEVRTAALSGDPALERFTGKPLAEYRRILNGYIAFVNYIIYGMI